MLARTTPDIVTGNWPATEVGLSITRWWLVAGDHPGPSEEAMAHLNGQLEMLGLTL